jgi:hypothetical protein
MYRNDDAVRHGLYLAAFFLFPNQGLFNKVRIGNRPMMVYNNHQSLFERQTRYLFGDSQSADYEFLATD